MAVKYFPVKAGDEERAVACYWAKAPGYSEADILRSWSGGDGARQQDASELAKLAAMKWEATCDYGTVASSFAEMQSAIHADPRAEVTVMLLAEAKWFEDRILGVALLHRTWAGNVFLDYIAAHPAADGQIGGIGVGLLYQICDLSSKLQAGLLWGETAAHSAEFYQRVFGLESVRDQLLVSLDQQRAFCQRVEDKWRRER